MAISDPTAAQDVGRGAVAGDEPEIPTRLTMLASCQRVVEWIAAPTKPAIPAGLATRRESSSEATTPAGRAEEQAPVAHPDHEGGEPEREVRLGDQGRSPPGWRRRSPAAVRAGRRT